MGNRGTNETRWDPPPAMAAAAPMNPMGMAPMNPMGGAPMNMMGGAPGGCAGAPNGLGGAPGGFTQPGMATMAPQAAAPAAAAPGQLPPGWESAVDPSSQKTYYFNRATNETK